MKSSQKGFTLLELLVVVAILAAIAGTAAIALQDTDARASAAAHVAMMDELNKGVATYRVLHKNVYPNNFDSLAYVTDGTVATATANAVILPSAGADGDIFGVSADDIALAPLVDGALEALGEIGITGLRYVDAKGTVEGFATGDSCDPVNGALQRTVSSRRNDIVAGNIFNGKEGHGCGLRFSLAADSQVAYWTGSLERVLGPGVYGDANVAIDDTTGVMSLAGAPVATGLSVNDVAPVLMAVGFGPASDLFKPEILGSMTSVPVYRHVREDQYNRFIGLFRIGEFYVEDDSGLKWSATPRVTEQVLFVGVVDGAGDTKEEELGEWDGTRSTI
jgi:prepilin-type N-terminal cleavage/methylation domain-containing protein